MNRLFLLLLLLALGHFQNSFAEEKESSYYLTKILETDDCLISFVECSNNRFVVKQIKDPSPDEQFLLVLDTLGCFIAEAPGIPVNKVTIIPSNQSFIGKALLEFPATLHTLAIGVCTDQECRYQDIDLHQRFRKENSPMWRRWGPLPPEKTGLTIAIIQNMAKHKDLPKIVALDTFVGNADRSAPNLYYDHMTDRFCGIDMAASFSSPLALVACQQLREAQKNQFTDDELLALAGYSNTLESLIKNWPPEKQENILLEYCKMAGFKAGSFLYDQNVVERIEFHKKCIKENYKNCVNLLEIVNQLSLKTF